MSVFALIAAPECSAQHAPAIVLPHCLALHFQMPPANRFILVFPQKEHKYFEVLEINIFLTIFRSEAPYLVPYLPQMPTFFVRFAMSRIRTGYPPLPLSQ